MSLDGFGSERRWSPAFHAHRPHTTKEMTMTKIFVGSLPFSTTEEQLQDLFKAHGAVTKATLINDRETGRSRGFGFVEMPNDAEAQAAITALNGSTLEGRQIVANVARPMESRGGGGGGRGGFGGRRGGGGGKRDDFKRW